MPRRALVCSLALSLASVCLLDSTTAFAQITAVTNTTSTPMPGTGHDYIHLLSETVNPANGSVSIRIQTPTAKSRGFTLPFSINYDSNGIFHLSSVFTQYSGGAVWTPDHLASGGGWPGGGWSYATPTITSSFYQLQKGNYPNYYPCDVQTGYVFTDSQGTRHSLGLGEQDADTGSYCTVPGTGVAGGGDGRVWATLATTNSCVNAGCTPPGIYPAPVTLYTPDGTVYRFPASNAHGLPSTIEDRNGNTINVYDNPSNNPPGQFTFTDTNGRTFLSSNGIGPGGATNTIVVSGLTYLVTWKTTSASYSVPTTPIKTSNGTCSPPSGVGGNETVISSIRLPNGTFYTFYYGTDNPDPSYQNPYGLISEIDYPSGAWVKYKWNLSATMNEPAVYPSPSCTGACQNVNVSPVTDGCIYQYATPVLTSRVVGFGGSSSPSQTQTFTYSTQWNSVGDAWTQKSTNVYTMDNVTGKTALTAYTYLSMLAPGVPFNYTAYPGQIPMEDTIKYYDWNSTLLRTVKKQWANLYDLKSEQTTFNDITPSPSTQDNYLYVSSGPFSLLQETDEYDFAASSPSRKSITTYQSFSGTPGFISNAPCKAVIYDSGGNAASETDFLYDGGTTVCGTSGSAATTAVGGLVSGTHDETTFAPTSTTPRGNITKKIQWLNGGTSPATTYTYDETGQVLSMTDACGNPSCADILVGANHTTTYSYADAFTTLSGGSNVSYTAPNGATNSYLTQITDPLGHVSKFTYDYFNGQLTSSKDPNDVAANRSGTTYIYNDLFSRPTQVSTPDGGQTTYAYNDSSFSSSANTPSVTKTVKINSSVSESTLTATDGMGKVVRTILSSDPDGPDTTDITYDGFGRILRQSNPHRSGSSPSDGTTSYTYDALGRTTSVLRQDGSVVNTTYDQTSTINPNTTCTTLVDEAGTSRKSCSDGLGRLIEVDEPGTGGSAALPGRGSVTIGGSEQTHAASAGRGSLSLSTNSASCGTIMGNTVPQNGTIYVTVNGVQSSTGWGGNCSNGSPATPGSVSITINGSEQNKGGTAGSGSITISSGSANCIQPGLPYSQQYQPQSGTIFVTINGAGASAGWGGNCNSSSETLQPSATQLAANLAASINASGANVTATANGTTISLVANAAGANTNYSVSVTESWGISTSQGGQGYTACCSGALTGGTNGTTDSGTVSVNVNGYVGTASYGAGSLSSNVASALASSLNSSSSVSATATGNVVTVTSRTVGASTNYPFSASWTWNTAQFTSPSFTVSPSSGSLANGSDGTPSGETLQPSIGTLASNLASAITSSGAGVTATANGSTINLVANTTGASTNYSVSTNETYALSTGTNGQGYTISGGSSLTGGSNAAVDSGTVSISVNGYLATQAYASTDTAQSVAAGLTALLNSSSSPVTASLSGGTITMTSRLTGAATNYSLSSSSAWNTQYFSNPSFTASPSGLALTGGSDSTLGSNPLVTLYSYDSLNNLICAVQKGIDANQFTTCAAAPATWRPRSFVYDSLSRLTSATNPESGTVTYAYDANGNLATKVQPKMNKIPADTSAPQTNTISYFYDVENRLIKKSYSDNGAPVQYAYDGGSLSGCTYAVPTLNDTNPIHRRTAICDASGATHWALDITSGVGWRTTEARNINNVTNSIVTQSNFAGMTYQLTYPSGRTITYGASGAGRYLSAIDSANSINYAQNATYAPFGGLLTLTNGSAPITVTNAYNDRLQPATLSAATAANTLFSKTYDFHLGSGDNGNVFQVINNLDSSRSQSFTYDALNRIATAQSAATSGTKCWGENFTIDAWGNLTNKAVSQCTAETLNAPATNQNQISGYCYDKGGNMLGTAACPTLPYTPMYYYDAENRLRTISASQINYLYDGDGVRREKSNGTLYWGDGPLAESDLSGSATSWKEYIFFNGKRIARRDASNSTVHYFYSDHLGSSSVIVNATGTLPVEEDLDYFPYGGIAYGAPSDHYEFTGKERDAESGLDNFPARHFTSNMGRWMTPDIMGGHADDPQTLNKYAYARNNPVSLTDPTGLDSYLQCTHTDQNASTCQQQTVGKDKDGNEQKAWVQGVTDKNGTFTATLIGNQNADGTGPLVDKTTGTGTYTASVNGSGVEFSNNGGQSFSSGVFVNGTPQTTFQDAGWANGNALSGFTFTLTNSKLEAGQTEAGFFFGIGNKDQVERAIEAAGFQHRTFGLHFGFDEYRSPGDPHTGANSGHFSVNRAHENPRVGVPITPGDMHFGETNPSTGFFQHVKEWWQ